MDLEKYVLGMDEKNERAHSEIRGDIKAYHDEVSLWRASNEGKFGRHGNQLKAIWAVGGGSISIAFAAIWYLATH